MAFPLKDGMEACRADCTAVTNIRVLRENHLDSHSPDMHTMYVAHREPAAGGDREKGDFKKYWSD
jgi:hypothetical protein